MFKEFKFVRQEPEHDGYRRWFEADDQELIVWYTTADRIKGFQLLYQRHDRKYAFTWHTNGSCSHTEIDEGDDLPFRNQSPMLVPDGALPKDLVLRQFKAAGQSLEPELVRLVTEGLQGARLPE